jgi:Calcium binding
MAGKRAFRRAKSPRVFGHPPRRAKAPFHVGLYARFHPRPADHPTADPGDGEYAARRGWTITLQVKEIGSGASQRERREACWSRAPPRDRRSAGVATGSLAKVRNRSARYPPGTGASGSGFRIADRSARPDDASWSSHGRTAGSLRRVRGGDSAGASSCGTRPGTAEGQTIGPARNRSAQERLDTEAVLCRRQQSRGCTAPGDWAYLSAAHPGGQGVVAEMAKRKKHPVREDRIHNEAIVDAYGPEEQALGWYYYLDCSSVSK